MIKLAWKNIWRNKTRSSIILCAIIIGVISGTLFTAFYNGMIYQRIEAAIANETSNIQIHSIHYLDNREITDTISEINKIISIIDTSSVVKSYAERIKIPAMINSANNNTGIMLIGVNKEQEKTTTQLWKKVVEGEFLPENKTNSIFIGKKLAEKLKIKLKSKVVLTFQDLNGQLVSGAFRVYGIYYSGNSFFDERMVYAHQSTISNLIGSSGKKVIHEIAISTIDDNLTYQYSENLKKKIISADIKTWKDIYPEVGMLADYTKYLQLIYMTIIYLALSFGIINTMLMAVMERTREIGMLMAIGMNKTRIFFMINLETILIMTTGTIVGLGFSYLLNEILGQTGINLTAFAQGLNQMGFDAIIYPVLTMREYLHTMILVLIAGFLSSLIPARKALKLSPAEAIRKL